jgi:hypothetical protein
MDQFNVYDFYLMATQIHPLSELQYGVKVKDVVYKINTAKGWLSWLIQGKPIPLVFCKPSANEVWGALEAVIPSGEDKWKALDLEAEVEPYQVYRINSAITKFETVISAELQSLSTYYVSQQGIYNTTDLIDRAELALGNPKNTEQTIGEAAKKDFNQAGRCLAFELPTASAFHCTRSVEATLRKYHRLVKNLPDNEKSPDMAVCINELRSAGEDTKVMDVLDHIRDLHRNTVMHPEAFLSLSEALRLFDISKSAINAMADRIGELSAPPALGTVGPL